MTKKLVYVLLMSLIVSCQTNSKKEEVDMNNFDLPIQKKHNENNIVGFACYEDGSTSKPVEIFSTILANKDYKKVKNKLEKTWPAEKFLATVICEKLVEKKLIILSESELHLIKKNKISKEEVETCSGCTNNDEVTLKDLFSNNKKYLMDQFYQWFKINLKT